MEKYVKVRKNDELLFKARLADSFYKRLSGLIPEKELPDNRGLLITRCRQVHTFFMRFPIDLVFLTKYHEVLGIEKNVSKNRVSKRHKRAYFVLELAAGAADKAGLKTGDMLEL